MATAPHHGLVGSYHYQHCSEILENLEDLETNRRTQKKGF
jgi:hypothetical protein